MKNKNNVHNFDFICVSGYGRSGSSACVDLLKEFEHINGPNKEFRIAKDPYGLVDLESSLVDNWEFIRHNVAINDFLRYCSLLDRKEGILKRVGKNFSDELSVDLMRESIEYIDRLDDFIYFGDSMLNRYYINSLQAFLQRMKSKFGLINVTPMYFSRPSKDKFLVETRRYLRRVFNNYAINNKAYKIVLDQAISPTNINKALRYFDNAKLIIVDRDPRDIYATMLKEKCFLGADVISDESVHKYIKWHKHVRKQTEQDINSVLVQNNVLRLNFEDLFLHYDKTIKLIKEFLDIDFSHKKKGSKFKPEGMRNYVGVWKNMLNQESIFQIEEELSEYCSIS